MGNICQNDVLRAELSGMMGLKQVPWHSVDPSAKDPQETASSFHPATVREMAKVRSRQGPSPTDGYYMEVPALLPQVAQRLQENSTLFGNPVVLRQPSNIYNREYHGPFKFFTVDMVYMGQWQDGRPHGRGRAYYSDGSVYDGEFNQGVPMGFGRYVVPNGDYYEGDVCQGQAHGVGCYITATSTFKGSFVNDMREGWGQQQTNEYRFEGYFKAGERLNGTLIWADCKYVGDFANDQFDGKGSITTDEGNYTGDFVEGKKHGFGVFAWPDGTIYKGCYEHDYRAGEGVYLSPLGQVLSVAAEIEI